MEALHWHKWDLRMAFSDIYKARVSLGKVVKRFFYHMEFEEPWWRDLLLRHLTSFQDRWWLAECDPPKRASRTIPVEPVDRSGVRTSLNCSRSNIPSYRGLWTDMV